MEQVVLELEAELRLRQRADVRLHEGTVQKARDQRGVVGLEQSPGRVALPEPLERLEIHVTMPA